MQSTITFYGLWAIRILVALAFLAAGSAKLIGAEMMVATFDAIGVGQWFRYVTGLIEVGGAVLLFVPGLQLVGAVLLSVTMVGAIIAHLAILGPSAVPALILLILSATLAYAHRGQRH